MASESARPSPRPVKIDIALPENYMGFDVEFHPLVPGVLGCSASEWFGIVGSGLQLAYRVPRTPDSDASPRKPHGSVVLGKSKPDDSIFSCSWVHTNQSLVLAFSCGDGAVRVMRLGPERDVERCRVIEGHSGEVSAVACSESDPQLLVSGSWDKTCRLYDVRRAVCVHSFAAHGSPVHSVSWTGRGLFASATANARVRLWDQRSRKPALAFVQSGGGEILTCDGDLCGWTLATGATDGIVRLFDIRRVGKLSSKGGLLSVVNGHDFAVRSVRWSPHQPNILASASYDRSVAIWDFTRAEPLRERLIHHTEFATGVSFDAFCRDRVATCSWDETVSIVQLPGAKRRESQKISTSSL